MGFSEEKLGYDVCVPDFDTVLTTVHKVFNEVVPIPTAKYISELEKLTVKFDSQERSESDFQFLSWHASYR